MAKKSGKNQGENRKSERHRRTSRPNRKEETPEDDQPNPAMGRLDMERQMAQLGKLRQSQEFDSIDEVNEFLQQTLAEHGGMLPEREPETPLEQAQELAYQARETQSPKQAIRLAKKALRISEDCADAYLILGQLEAKTIEEAREYYEKAVAAGERAISPELFEEGRGHFWGIVETRPYMRARAELADLLWEMGEPETAIEHYRELLALNPGDNQGLRYVLLSRLLQIYRNDEAEALIAEYEDDAMASWLYNRALLAFRKHGRSTEADEALDEALDQNPYVPDLLLDPSELLESEMPDFHGWGDENEAILYAADALMLWAQTPGAQLWLAQRMDE